MRTHRHRAVWLVVMALTLALLFHLIITSLASAQNLAEYFQLSYNPVTFDRTAVQGSEVFHASITGRVTCDKALPISPSEATISTQVVAVHNTSGATVTLNPSYTISVKPFPAKAGETAEINQSVPLQFPAQAASGDYNIIGKIIKAEVKVSFVPLDVTGYFPQEQQMGLVKYTTASTTTPPSTSPPAPPAAPSTTPGKVPPSPSPQPAPPPVKSIPVGPSVPPSLPPPVTAMPNWVWLIVAVAAATIVFNIIWFLRHRYT